jgi:hypothetical protein
MRLEISGEKISNFSYATLSKVLINSAIEIQPFPHKVT